MPKRSRSWGGIKGSMRPMKRRRSRRVPRSLSTVNSTYITLGYSDTFTLSEAGNGLGAIYSFRLNSLYDPDLTGVGGQPVAFDQYALIYSKYLVFGGSWSVTFDNQVNRAAVVGCIVTSDPSVPTERKNWPASPGGKSRLLAGSGGGPSCQMVSGKITLAKTFGIKRSAIWNEANFESRTNTNPVQLLYLHVFTIGQAATTSYVTAHVKIWFKTRFTGRLNLADQ